MTIIHRYSYKDSTPAKRCAVLRYGGLGDAIQTSSILPWLKQAGYHITVYTVPASHEILKHDPHIDKFIVQDVDAVPNQDLGEFWSYTSKKYDRFINLSESVERTLLAYPNTTQYNWSHEMRRKYMGINYLEFMHDIAGVPFPPMCRFYPSYEEREWAWSERQKMKGKVVAWVLSGSGVHKTWGGLDHAINRIMKRNDGTNFVLLGDKSCKALEAGWESVARIHCRSGEWSARQSMAFAQIADVVIGPETGVMNAVSMEDVNKVVFMSHSSINNLTRDWVNCISLTAANTKCYPCHQIHFGWDTCNQHGNSGVSLCQADISIDAVVDAISISLTEKRIAA